MFPHPQVTGEDLNIVRPMMVTMLGMMNEDCLHRPRLPGHALAVPLVGLLLQNPVPPIRGTCVLVAIAGHREINVPNASASAAQRLSQVAPIVLVHRQRVPAAPARN